MAKEEGSMPFTATVRESQGTTLVDLSGRLTLGESVSYLRKTVEDVARQGHRHIVLNLREVEYVDSAGLGALVSCFTKVKGFGGEMKLLAVQPRVLELLKLTELDRVLPMFAEEPEVIESFGSA